LDMLMAVLIDYFNHVQQATSKTEINDVLFELDGLRVYYNSCIDNLNSRFEVRKFRKIHYDWSKLYA
jgi:hypothetical protein